MHIYSHFQNKKFEKIMKRHRSACEVAVGTFA